MDPVAPLTREDAARLLIALYRDMRSRRPQLFRGGEPWRPGGVYDLPDLLPRIAAAARLAHQDSPDGGNDSHRWTTLVCPSCQHQTPCGYCAHRGRDTCVLRGEAEGIIRLARREIRSWQVPTARQ